MCLSSLFLSLSLFRRHDTLNTIHMLSLFFVVYTCLLLVYLYIILQKRDPLWDGENMSWVLLSFAVITPMLASLQMAFSRRETAMLHISRFRSTCTMLYSSHATWDWPLAGRKSGRAASSIDWLELSDRMLEEIIHVGDDLCRFLTLPTASRARHNTTTGGKIEARHLKKIAVRLFQEISTRMERVSLYVEVLKREGLPANEGMCMCCGKMYSCGVFWSKHTVWHVEDGRIDWGSFRFALPCFLVLIHSIRFITIAIRMRNWQQVLMKEMEDLEKLKMYRTPQAMRSLSRLFSVILPPFYAPYYAQLARDVGSLTAGIIFAIIASLVLPAVFESMTQMEDPFVPYVTLDGIDVHRELREYLTSQLIAHRENVLFVGSRPFRNKNLIRRMSTRTINAHESLRFLSPE